MKPGQLRFEICILFRQMYAISKYTNVLKTTNKNGNLDPATHGIGLIEQLTTNILCEREKIPGKG